MTEKIATNEFSSDKEVHQLEFDDGANQHRTGSSFGAYFNIVCVIAGTGTLQLPLSLHQGGWISLIMIVLSACIAVYTGQLLIKCLYYDGVSRLPDYPSIGQAAFGKPGKFFVRVFYYSIQLGASCIYILLAGQNARGLLQSWGVNASEKVCIIVAAVVVCIPYIALKTLKEVAILAAFGAVATLVVVLTVVIEGFIQLPKLPPGFDNSHVFVHGSGLPIALASISFSYGGNVIYPHVEEGMRHPKSWPKVLAAAIGTITGMYLLISICGYYVYGNMTESPIYLNLPQNAGYYISVILITIHVIFAAPILLTSFANEMEMIFKIDRKYHSAPKEFFLRASLRSVVIVVLTVIALFLPYVPDLMSLIGALSNCIIVFVAPIVLYFKLFGWRSVSKLELLWCLIVVAIGLLGCVLGAKDAIISLINNIEKDKQV
ncbi:hypothetical protein K493DRAFT_312452 [Basidiobolus meristosporus CBS 931.73]|uniref:Amino acid transporter transmembrane domain-containing protein n=1 Tax=Basidiobolus meristosporus CBS 931.73 TaxID=1314790 RepID=A0A1Y1YTN4_9FUNG|nr:hypothetical protein K493DRAFT_312452 [Basidiobolus meristosporus CBS 931.73]|eukprot:ORY01398.1 hypothetical protein K493DRAFT_312452 [Basidiobolus meristosporus CBS 931.73]